MKPWIKNVLTSATLLGAIAVNFGCTGRIAALASPSAANAGELPVLATSAPAPTPAADLGEDVMKPMAELFGAVQAALPDGSKNIELIANIKKLQDLVAIAWVSVPATDHYRAEVALVGADAALSKYKGLLQALDVTLAELAATVRKSGTQACGVPCQGIMGQLGALEGVGHGSFRD